MSETVERCARRSVCGRVGDGGLRVVPGSDHHDARTKPDLRRDDVNERAYSTDGDLDLADDSNRHDRDLRDEADDRRCHKHDQPSLR